MVAHREEGKLAGPSPEADKANRIEIAWARPERRATGWLLVGVAGCLALVFITIYGLAYWADGHLPPGNDWLLALVPTGFLVVGWYFLQQGDAVVVDLEARTLRRGNDCCPLADATAVVVTRHIKSSTNGKGGRLHTPYWKVSILGEGADLALPSAGGHVVVELLGKTAANMLLESMNPLPVWDLAQRLSTRLGLPLLVVEDLDQTTGLTLTPDDVAPSLARRFEAPEPARPESSKRSPTLAEGADGELSLRWEEKRLASLKFSAALAGILMAVPALVCLVLAIKRDDAGILAIPVAVYAGFVLLLWGIDLLSPYERTLIVDRSSIQMKTRGGFAKGARLALPEVRAVLLAGGDFPGLRIIGPQMVLCCLTNSEEEARWVRWKIFTHLARS